MTKYKIVGIINLLFGILQLMISAYFLLSLLPKLGSVYSGFNPNSHANFMSGYVMAVLILIIAIVSLFLGAKGLSRSKNKERYLKYGIISALITPFLTIILAVILVVSTISPIYNLTYKL